MYYLSIGCIFKNESCGLYEFIEHNILHGVEHIYLINDFSNDNFIEILQPYINIGILTLYVPGINKNAFLNFYEAQGIDLIYLPKDYCLKPDKNGFDPIPLIKKSKVEYKEVAWVSGHSSASKNELNQLFK